MNLTRNIVCSKHRNIFGSDVCSKRQSDTHYLRSKTMLGGRQKR